jgi:hypothetical protein
MRSGLVVRASDCRNSPGFDPSILRHRGILRAADEAVLKNVHIKKKKKKKSSFKMCICTNKCASWSMIYSVCMQWNLPTIYGNNKEDMFWSIPFVIKPNAGIFKLLRSPGIDSKESIHLAYLARVRILKQSMGARNREEIGLWYRLIARLHRLAESIPGLLKCLKIPALAVRPVYDNPVPTRFLAPHRLF